MTSLRNVALFLFVAIVITRVTTRENQTKVTKGGQKSTNAARMNEG
jgi:hypothetical protein